MRNACLSPLFLSAAALLLAGMAAPAAARDEDPAVIRSRTSDRLAALPRLPINQRKIVTIYEFRSGVAGIDNRALTDMFTNALVTSGAFAVVERQRVVPDLTTEKSLNARGATSGDTASRRLAGAQYIFEGVVSEAAPDEDSSEGAIALGGMEIGGRSRKGEIAIDVRVLDADSGMVLDSVAVSKKIEAGGKHVSGIGNLAQSVAGLSGASIPLDPNASFATAHNEGVDRALRACIETAVLELAQRYTQH